jgi:hypothetical protein
MIEVNGTRGYGGERDGRFRGGTIEAVARPSGHRDDASGRFADEMNEAEAVYFARLASAPFMAQLAALYLGDAHTGERRVERDPGLVRARANGAYRAAGRLTSTLEAGFMDEVSY